MKEQKESKGTQLLQMAGFKVAGDKYAIDIMYIKEITRYQAIKKIPRAPVFVEGVINLRGTIIPVLDLRKRLDATVSSPTKKTRILIVALLNRLAGLLVDEATEVIRVSREQLRPAPGFAKTRESQFLSGVLEKDGELILILDIERLLTDQERTNLMGLKASGG